MKLINADCMDIMKDYPDKYFDLAIVDPPYNINKANWDKYNKIEYQQFILKMMLELQRVMKDNASIYFFHNDFLQLSRIQVNLEEKSNYILRQLIVWNKRFLGSKNKGFFDGYVEVENLRNYQKLSEYILFFTFQDETGLSKIMNSCVYPIRDYIRKEILSAKGKIILKEINNILGTANNGGGVASACLSLEKTEPAMMTKEHYEKLRIWLNNRKEYEYLRKKYEDLRKEYEDLRYYFKNQKTCHSVWDFEINNKNTFHPTTKPINLITNILLHSCKENGKIIVPFLGSGNDAIAWHYYQKGGEFVGIEIDKEYFDKAKERIERETKQLEFNL